MKREGAWPLVHALRLTSFVGWGFSIWNSGAVRRIMACMGKTKALFVLAGAMVLALGLGCSGKTVEAETGGTTEPPVNVGGDSGAPMVTASQVSDLLNQRCVTCHSGEKAKEDLHLDSIAGLINGGDDGAVLVAGNAAESKILKHMRGEEGVKRMPPPPNDPLTEAEIQMVEDWINAGANAD
jgi:uncharacterized membrane protein